MAHDVFEISGGNQAASNGWDITVCRSLKEALDVLEADLDALDEEGEIVIRFRRYTDAQMEDVIFEP